MTICELSQVISGITELTMIIHDIHDIHSAEISSTAPGAKGCWDVEAGASCSIECKPPFFGPSSLASCPASNTDPTTPLDFDLTQPQG